MPRKRKIKLLRLRALRICEFTQTELIVVTDRAADILFALFSSVPLSLASPVYLASFAAIYFMVAHFFLLSIKYNTRG